ncbi:LacI family transcriptional regulator [Streptomyces sp. 846.5]|nr:LacI family DNA-binding transcriptional regulator [Streptomyces sp. 846.5]TDT97938.1 LacI family transcriptional regulator [Streptomyces sp. 846.5]
MLPDHQDDHGARSVTMRDVASQAGVGIATVSRVVNGKAGVTADVVERVTRAAQLLGYRHDLTASSLRRADRRTGILGLVLEDVANPFSSALQRAVEDAATERGVLVLAGSSDEDPVRERGLIQTFSAHRVDGLVVVPTGQAGGLAAALDHDIPVVCVDRVVDGATADTVTTDNRLGVRECVRALHALGHRRIAFLGDLAAIWTARERYAGFAEGMDDTGCRPSPALVRRGLHTQAAAEKAVGSLLELPDPPTAIFSAQNLITVGARRVLQNLELEYRVALIGFDDFPLADLLSPGVSVVAQDPAAMGREAARLLFERLDGEKGPIRHSVVATRWIARGSGELPGPHAT